MKRYVTIHNSVSGVRLPRKWLESLAEIVLVPRRAQQSVNLIMVRDPEMKKINKRFRGIDRTTDVLSFSLDDNSQSLLGEIYISIPTAKRNARSLGVTLNSELIHLFCHGLLHLLGHDHKSQPDQVRMEKLEDRYLKMLVERLAG